MARTVTPRVRAALGTTAAYAAVAAYYALRPLPKGVNAEARTYRVPADAVRFLHDSTWHEHGRRRSELQITPHVLQMIDEARELTVIDLFLFNLHHTEGDQLEPTTRRIADALACKAHARHFITDPFNTLFGTERSEPLEWLHEAGVRLCFTDTRRLRDNSILLAPFWRLAFQWFDTGNGDTIRSPVRTGRRTTVRALLEAINVRANHRKVVICDAPHGVRTLVTSANLDDASSYFCNVAVEIRSRAVARHFLASEKAVAAMSGCTLPVDVAPGEPEGGPVSVTPLMGGDIERAVLDDLAAAESGDDVFVAMLFLSQRRIVRSLVRCARRGVRVVAVLDRNRVTFGQEKNGLPNEVVAEELTRSAPIHVRWATSEPHEFHTKLLVIRSGDTLVLHTGSANFSRRNLSSTTLEANVRIAAPLHTSFARDVGGYVDRTAREPQSSPAGQPPLERRRYWLYRFQEATGAGKL